MSIPVLQMIQGCNTASLYCRWFTCTEAKCCLPKTVPWLHGKTRFEPRAYWFMAQSIILSKRKNKDTGRLSQYLIKANPWGQVASLQFGGRWAAGSVEFPLAFPEQNVYMLRPCSEAARRKRKNWISQILMLLGVLQCASEPGRIKASKVPAGRVEELHWMWPSQSVPCQPGIRLAALHLAQRQRDNQPDPSPDLLQWCWWECWRNAKSGFPHFWFPCFPLPSFIKDRTSLAGSLSLPATGLWNISLSHFAGST